MPDYTTKAVFFDVRGTLGEVDRPGHLLPYHLTTARLLGEMRSIVGLKVGVISNLPSNLTSADGKKMLDDAGITPFLDPKAIVFNVDDDIRVDKPKREIFVLAAARLGLEPAECLFSGENLTEVLAATAAGMRGVLKPSPPGREFDLKPPTAASTPTSSGLAFEMFLEEEHLLGKRIVGCAAEISKRLEAGQPPMTALGLLVYLLNNFIDPYHHRKEEIALLPLLRARGMPAAETAFMLSEHDQGRSYFRSIDIGLRRLAEGNAKAAREIKLALDGFIELYRAHGMKENDQFFPAAGKFLKPADDVLIVSLMAEVGPRDITPFIALIQTLEADLGVVPS